MLIEVKRHLKRNIENWVKELGISIDVMTANSLSGKDIKPIIEFNVASEIEITNANTGLLSIDTLAGTKQVLYTTDYTFNVSVSSTLDEEAETIREKLIDKMRRIGFPIKSKVMTIVKINDKIDKLKTVKEKKGEVALYRLTFLINLRASSVKDVVYI